MDVMSACVFVIWQCSVTCDEGIQQRQVVCKASDNTVGECEGEKPETVTICRLSPCPGEIHVHVNTHSPVCSFFKLSCFCFPVLPNSFAFSRGVSGDLRGNKGDQKEKNKLFYSFFTPAYSLYFHECLPVHQLHLSIYPPIHPPTI